MQGLSEKIKSRKVVQWALGYLAGGWLFLQIAGFLADVFHWPNTILRPLTVLVAVGLFIAVVIAWYHGERGQQRVGLTEVLVISALLVIGASAAAYVTRSSPEQRATTDSSAGIPTNSIAVLPFLDMSPAHDQEYFSDGISEELISALANVPGLRVAARTSSFAFKGRNESIPNVARQLQVHAVLEGSVRKAGNTLRITAELVDAKTGYHLWSNSYDRELNDIFAVQAEISRSIVRALKVHLLARDDRLGRVPTTSSEAHDLYLRGRYLWGRRTAGSVNHAIAYFQQAIARDSTYADAYAALASAYDVLPWPEYAGADPREAYPKGRAAAERALELDPNMAEAYANRGIYYSHMRWDFDRARDAYERAIELNPSYERTYSWYGWSMVLHGQVDSALALTRTAVARDPLSSIANSDLAAQFYFQRRYADALAQFRRTLELDSAFAPAHSRLGQTYAVMGRFADAEREFKTAIALSDNNPFSLAGLAYTYARSGKRTQALRIEVQLRRLERTRYVPKFAYVLLYVGLDDRERAFAALDDAFEERSPFMMFLNAIPWLDPLRSDARFRALVKKVGARDIAPSAAL